MDDRLTAFTHDALTRGMGREETARALAEAGWPADDIDAALNRYADVAFPMPVPAPRLYVSARDVFLHLVLFTALYVSLFSVGAIAFSVIDRLIPDPLFDAPSAEFLQHTLRWHLSYLIVAFPVFLITFRATARGIERDPSRRGSWPRKWLTYLTLFVSALVLGGDMVVLVYNLLGGEFALRFLLKIAVVAVLAGGTFFYFLSDMRADEENG